MLLFCLLAVLGMTIADQGTKYLISSTLAVNEKIPLIQGFFSINHLHNYGAGFSIMQNQRTFFLILTPLALTLLVYFLVKSKSKWEKIAISMMIAGAVGNFIDRIRLTYVVDFLDFIIFGYDFPVFNLADVFLTVGAGLFLLFQLKGEKHA